MSARNPFHRQRSFLRNQWSCKVVQSSTKTYRAPTPLRTVVLLYLNKFAYRKWEQSLRRTEWGYLSQSPPCLPSESLQTAPLLWPVCFRGVCEKRRRGVWDCVSFLKLKPRRGGRVSDEKGDRSAAPNSLLLELPIMLCMPSHRTLYGLGFGARSLTHLPTATSFFFFLLILHYYSFPASTISSMVKCFNIWESLIGLWRNRPNSFNLTAKITRAWLEQHYTGSETMKVSTNCQMRLCSQHKPFFTFGRQLFEHLWTPYVELFQVSGKVLH